MEEMKTRNLFEKRLKNNNILYIYRIAIEWLSEDAYYVVYIIKNFFLFKRSKICFFLFFFNMEKIDLQSLFMFFARKYLGL